MTLKLLRAWLPLLLTVAGFTVFGVLNIWRIVSLGPTLAGVLAAATSATYGGWLLWESRVSARERHRLDMDLDRGTVEVAAAAKNILLLCCLLPESHPNLPLGAVGWLLLAFGAGLRIVSVRSLGAGYSHRIRPPCLPLVTDGPYAVVRHPAFLGTLLAHAGFALVFISPWSIAALALLWTPAVLLRVRVEDQYLCALPEYATYARRVRSRLIPGVA